MGTEPLRILVVDDAEEVREFFQFVLERAGYRVDTAENGREALQKVISQRPALMLVDVVMPVMDGLELLLKVRSDLAPPVPAAILISGFDMTEAEALRRGAVRFLPKPVDGRDLIAAVADVVAGRVCADDGPARARADAARAQAREIAVRLTRGLEVHAPPGQPFSAHAAAFVGFVARYLANEVVFAAVLRDNRLVVLGSSNPSRIAPDVDIGAALPLFEKVVESGSSLMIPDVAAHPSFAWLAHRIPGMHCLMGVPIRFEDRAIGVLVALDSCACAITGEDLALLQHFSRRGTELLQAWAEGRLDDELPYQLGPGVSSEHAFEKTLDLELRLLHARGGSLELALVDPADGRAVHEALAQAANRSRLMAGLMQQRRVAIYKRDAGAGARAKLAAVLATLRARGPVHVGIVDVADQVFSTMHAEDLLRLAGNALDAAMESPSAVRRMVVEGESA